MFLKCLLCAGLYVKHFIWVTDFFEWHQPFEMDVLAHEEMEAYESYLLMLHN